jgi:hypothetical protein
MDTQSQGVLENNARFEGDDRATKRQFGGPSTISQTNSIFQNSNSFGQSQPSNPFGSTQQPSGGNMFPFGGSQQSGASGITFNSGSTTPAKPADNPFTFQPNSQPALSTPSTSFGSGPFNFNRPSAQAHNGSAGSPFLFTANAGQPSSSSGTFSSNPATIAPTSNAFGTPPTTATAPPADSVFGVPKTTAPSFSLYGNRAISAPSQSLFSAPTTTAPSPSSFGATSTSTPQSSNLFGTVPATTDAQDKPASSPFQFGKVSGPAFGSTPATAPATSNPFGTTQSQQPTQSTNSFGPTNQHAASSSNPFAYLNVPASPASNAFGKQEQKTAAPTAMFGTQNSVQAPAPSSQFGNSAQAPTTSSTSTLFGQPKPQSSSSNMFGNLNKPTTSTSEFNDQNQQAPTSSSFGNKEARSTNDLFGNLNKPVDQSVTQPKVDGKTAENGVNSSSSLFSKQASPAFNILGAAKSSVSCRIVLNDICKENTNPVKFAPSPAKPAEATTNGIKPAVSFGSTQPAMSLNSGNIFSPMKPVEAPASASQPPSNGVFPSLEQAKSPQKSNEASFSSPNPAASSTAEPSQREISRQEMAAAREQLKEATEITDESMAHLPPAHFNNFQRKKFFIGYRIRTLNNAMAKLYTFLRHDEDPAPDLEFYKEQRRLIIGDSLTVKRNEAVKRKIGEGQSEGVDQPAKRSKQTSQSVATESHEQQSKRKLNDDEDQENENPSKRTRQTESSNPARGLSNGELNSNGHASTPAKGNNVQPWNAPTSQLLPTSETPLKRKAENQITKDFVERSPLRPMKTPKMNGTVDSSSTTSNIFRNILDSPSKSPGESSPEKKMAALPETSKDETTRPNPFAGLPGVSPFTKSTFGSLSSNTPATKATSVTSTVSSQNVFAPKSTLETPNMFAQELAAPSDAAGSNGTEQKPNVLKPPTFGVLTNPIDQFKQKAGETEEKELQKAIDEDYDSDDDLEEFKVNWKAERLAKKKAIEEAAKGSKGFQMIPTASTSTTASSPFKMGGNQANTTSEPSGAVAQSSIGPKPLFGQSTSSQVSGNSLFSTPNASRTPTPGLNGSSTGSVFDGHTAAKPTNFNNIFAYLSDAESGKGGAADDESGKGGAADDESDKGGAANDESENEASDTGDSENKDPTYQPGGENKSCPGTPVEETGAGIASAKKINSLTFGGSKAESASPSGTSTPSGGLFDRVGPRQPGTDEKENTQPTTANLFGGVKSPFNKSTGAPSNQTWDPNSPIKFGSATPHKDGRDSAPTVNVTAATPTKTGSPSNLFGGLTNTTGSTPKPLSSLFGNSGGESKPAASFSNIFGTPSNAMGSTSASVGFGFGASSTTSSLFPSAAASTTTSRATTPGATTDGDNSGDGDAEKEEEQQINLTAGGPGEEDEEAIHEVRAKALKFLQGEGGDSSNKWETQGVGPLRVLKHKETGVSRILLRADPRGTIVLNKALLSGVKYEAQKKTVKFLTAGEHGNGIETWLLQVKTEDFAKTLAEVLEANKA